MFFGEGRSLTGEAESKSEAALELIKRGHRLGWVMMWWSFVKVSDVTLLVPHRMYKAFYRASGSGIIDVKTLFGVESVKDAQSVDLVIRSFEEGTATRNMTVWDLQMSISTPWQQDRMAILCLSVRDVILHSRRDSGSQP